MFVGILKTAWSRARLWRGVWKLAPSRDFRNQRAHGQKTIGSHLKEWKHRIFCTHAIQCSAKHNIIGKKDKECKTAGLMPSKKLSILFISIRRNVKKQKGELIFWKVHVDEKTVYTVCPFLLSIKMQLHVHKIVSSQTKVKVLEWPDYKTKFNLSWNKMPFLNCDKGLRRFWEKGWAWVHYTKWAKTS